MIDLQQNYQQEEVTVNAVKANLFVVLLFVPLAIVLALPFYLVWQHLFTAASLRLYFQENINWLKATLPLLIFGPLIAGIILHELIHGLTWARFATQGFKSIRFGIMWKVMTPYCHCKEPLSLKGYRLGVIMPAVVLGFIPLIYAFVTGNVGIFVFGFFFTIAAGGDFMMLYLLRKEHVSSFVQDHPDKIGCYVYRRKSA
jgi:hypothetical protein